METSFGADFSHVRVHEGDRAASLGARAYTQGSNIYFAPGQYDPHSRQGKELLGHELAHVVQQAEGRVPSARQAKGDGVSEYPDLEREADEQGARAARGEAAGRGAEIGRAGDSDAGGAEILVSLAQPDLSAASANVAGPIQAKRAGGQPRKSSSAKQGVVPFRIVVAERVTGKQLKVIVTRQALGYVPPDDDLTWNIKDDASFAPGTYTINFTVDALARLRAKARGIELGTGTAIAGAGGRAKRFHAGRSTATKSALLAEIRRRYYEMLGGNTRAPIGPGDKARADLWRAVRDEVLFQHERLANLPEHATSIIRRSITGRELAPADYDQLFRIAKAIEKLPPGQASDYASKIAASTTDLNVLEASLRRYSDEMAARGKHDAERVAIGNRLAGLEQVYKNYLRYKETSDGDPRSQARLGAGSSLKALRQKQLEKQLAVHKFGSIAEFEGFIAKFEKAFERAAAHTAGDFLRKYAGTLYRESERYKNPRELHHLHQSLAGFRTDYADAVKYQAIANQYGHDDQQRRLPGQGHLHSAITPGQATAATAKATAARGSAKTEIANVAQDYPLFREKGIPKHKRIDKRALAAASEQALPGLLAAHIAARMSDVEKARAELEAKPSLIYKMNKLMPQFYARQGIEPGSIYHLIIRNKMKSDAIGKLVEGIALTVLSIALAVVSAGAASPVIAGTAAVAGAGLSGYLVHDEVADYAQQKKLANVGLASDPGVGWLVISIVGAGIDVATAIKALKSIGSAARALHEGGELSEFVKAIRAAERRKEIAARVARAAEKAAAAKKGYADAWAALRQAMGKFRDNVGGAAMNLGDFDNPEARRALLAMARAGFKMAHEGGKRVYYTADKFIGEVRQSLAPGAKLSDEGIAKLKQIHREAEQLEAAEGALRHKALSELRSQLGAEAAGKIRAAIDDDALLARILGELSPTELQSFLSTAGAAKTKRIAKAAGPLAMKHHGASVWARLDESSIQSLKSLKTKQLDEVLELGAAVVNSLSNGLDGAKIHDLIRNFGKDIVNAVGRDLSGRDAGRVIASLGDDVVRGLATELGGKGLQQLEQMGMFAGKFDPTHVASLSAGQGAAVRALGTMDGKSIRQIQSELGATGFAHVFTKSDGMQVWTHSDGSLVRIKPTGSPNPNSPTHGIAHVVLEILKKGKEGQWMKPKSVFAKVAGNGTIIPTGTNFATTILIQWFSKIAGRKPTSAELDLLLSAWGKSGHLRITP